MAAHRLSDSNPNSPYLQRVSVRYLQFPQRWVIYGRQPCGVSVFSQSDCFWPAEGGGALFRGSRLARRVGLSEGRDQASRLAFENEWYAAFVVDTAGRIFCVISTPNGTYAHSPAHHTSHHVKQEKKRSYGNATWVFIVLLVLFLLTDALPFSFSCHRKASNCPRETVFNLLCVFYSAIE